MSLSGSRYVGAARALWALRGPGHAGLVAPHEVDVPYRDEATPAGRVAPRMDVYLPAPARRTGASVVLVHGGGFVVGSKAMAPIRFLASRLVEAGIAVAAPSYRLLFRGGGFEAALRDVLDAARFWRAGAAARGLVPERVSLAGLSAGGALAYVAAAELPWIERVVCAFGAYDLGELRGLQAVLPRLVFASADRAAWTGRLPLGCARHPCAPTLLLHGTADTLVPFAQAERLAALRQAAGLPTELAVFDGAPHGFFTTPSPHADAGVRRVIDFLG